MLAGVRLRYITPEKHYIETQLKLHGYSVPETAVALELLSANLYRKIRNLDIRLNDGGSTCLHHG